MIDEMDDLYEIAGQELKKGEERPGLMARATAEADGNPEKAKSLYIRYRVAELAENRQREAENKVRDEIQLMVATQGFIPELLAEARTSIPGFDTLSLGEKVQRYLNFEWPERLLRTADEQLHQRSDIEGAIQRYERVIKRFPDTKQAAYAKQQLSDMDLVRHGAIPEILEQARKLSGFDDLPLEEKLRWYMKFESPEILYRAGRHKHYEDGDTDAAVQRYNRVIERFPLEKEARYAQQQLDKIRAGVHPPEEIQALLAQSLNEDSCQKVLTLLGHKVTTPEPGKWTVQEPTGAKRFLYSFYELVSYTRTTAISALAKPDVKPPESSVLMPQGFIPEILAEVRKCTPGFDALPLGEKVARYLSSELPERLARMHRSCPNPVDKQFASHSEAKTSEQTVFDEPPSALDLWWKARQPAFEQQPSDTSRQKSTSTFIPQEAQPQKKHAKWPLRIGLYIALFVAWGFARTLFMYFKTSIHNAWLEEVLAGLMDAHQAAISLGILTAVGGIVIDLAALVLAIVIWRKTRKARPEAMSVTQVEKEIRNNNRAHWIGLIGGGIIAGLSAKALNASGTYLGFIPAVVLWLACYWAIKKIAGKI